MASTSYRGLAALALRSSEDPAAFLQNGGQRGRQRGILREGVYAINTALFVVITETGVHAGPVNRQEREQCTWSTAADTVV